MNGVSLNAVNEKADIGLDGIILRDLMLVVVKTHMEGARVVGMRHQSIRDEG